MMADLFWCETHKDRSTGEPTRCDSYYLRGIGVCSMVCLVESHDSDGRLLGLLVTEECDDCHGKGTYSVTVTTPPFEDSGDYPCEACGGSGQRYRALPAGLLP